MSAFTVTCEEVSIYVNKEITFVQTLLEMGYFASSLNSETSPIYWLTTKKQALIHCWICFYLEAKHIAMRSPLEQAMH